MMCFRQYFNPRSLLGFSTLPVRCGGAAAILVAGLLLMSGSALGYQANSSPAGAEQNKPAGKQAKVTAPKAPQKKLSESRIADLRAFAKSHQPEIVPLLDFLEKKRPKKFQKVINGLNRDVTNLERLKKRSAEAYERGLAMWINRSQIQLYAAQFKVAADEKTAAELRKKIRLLIEENLDARTSQIELDIANAQARIARLQKVAADIKSNREAMIEKKIGAATKRAPNINGGKKPQPKSPDRENEEKSGK